MMWGYTESLACSPVLVKFDLIPSNSLGGESATDRWMNILQKF